MIRSNMGRQNRIFGCVWRPVWVGLGWTGLEIWLHWKFGWVGDFVGIEIWLGWIFGRVGDLVECEALLCWTFGWAL